MIPKTLILAGWASGGTDKKSLALHYAYVCDYLLAVTTSTYCTIVRHYLQLSWHLLSVSAVDMM
jgi:hypothetical protein